MTTKVLEYIDKINILLKLQNKSKIYNHVLYLCDDYYKKFINKFKLIIYDIQGKYNFVYYKDIYNKYNLCIYSNYFNNKQIKYILCLTKKFDINYNNEAIIYNINYKKLIEIINQILLDE